MIKKYTNQEYKKLITELHVNYNISMDEELKKQLSKSSKIRYETLDKYYKELGLKIEELIKSENSSINDNKENNLIKEIEIQTKEVEIQTEIFDIINYPITVNIEIDNIRKENYDLEQQLNEKNKQIYNLSTELFTTKQTLSNYIYKLSCYKSELKKITKVNKNKQIDTHIQFSSDEENNIKQKRIPYDQLPELSSSNLIQELSKLSRHSLKQLYNKYFSNKLQRKLEI